MVNSINGQTGDVIIQASDIGAISSTIYNNDISNLLAQINANSTQITNLNSQMMQVLNNINLLQQSNSNQDLLIGNLATVINQIFSTILNSTQISQLEDTNNN